MKHTNDPKTSLPERGLSPLERRQVLHHSVQYSHHQHVLVIDDTVVVCTPTEYAILLRLLSCASRLVSFAHLLGCLYGGSETVITPSTRHILTQVISRLRPKMWPFNLDICCVYGRGYILESCLLEQPDDAQGTERSSPSCKTDDEGVTIR